MFSWKLSPYEYDKIGVDTFITKVKNNETYSISNGQTSSLNYKNNTITIYLNDLDHGSEIEFTYKLTELDKEVFLEFLSAISNELTYT